MCVLEVKVILLMEIGFARLRCAEVIEGFRPGALEFKHAHLGAPWSVLFLVPVSADLSVKDQTVNILALCGPGGLHLPL